MIHLLNVPIECPRLPGNANDGLEIVEVEVKRAMDANSDDEH